MEKKSVPICGVCPYMRMTGRANCNGNNDGNPRGTCYCDHPEALETFRRVCPRSPRAPGFIGFTPMGGNKPQIKTSPRWCPLRKEGEKLTVAEIIIRACEEAEKFDEACRIANTQGELTAWIEEWKAYKETGLTPEEVVALQASNQELKKEAMPLMKAKIEERLVALPPVKVGDEAFFIIKKRIFSGKVYYLRWEHHKSFGIRGDISADCLGGCVGARLSDFGKTVFRTRKEAETALKEQEG